MGDRGRRGRDHLRPRHPQLVLHVEVGCGEEDVHPGIRRRLNGRPAEIDVALVGTCESTDVGPVQSADFAREWIAENDSGLPRFKRTRSAETKHRIEDVGRSLRRMMTFVNAKEVLPGAASA